jgi:hypothetical protein
MPPIRARDIDTSEDEVGPMFSRKKILDELPVDACVLSSPHGDRDSDDDHVSVPPRRSRPSVRLSLNTKRGGKPKLRNTGSQSLPKPIALKGIRLQPTVVFDTFWRFAAERKAVDDRRRAGWSQP